jgi:tripartite-type tricarboxylate transporter receptor subunit TctC
MSLAAWLSLLSIAFLSSAALAAELSFPSKPVRIVVPAVPGGGTDILARLLSPRLQTLFGQTPFIQAGRLRAIAVCGAKRAASMPELPTVGETLKGFESSGWYALLGPAGVPREVTLKLQDGFAKALHTPEITRRLADLGVEVVASTPEELAKRMPLEIAKWSKVVKASGLQGE